MHSFWKFLNSDMIVAIVAAIIGAIFQNLLVNHAKPEYPSKEEFVFLQNRYKVYTELYYSICVNPQTKHLISEEIGMNYLLSFCESEYKDNIEMYKILSRRFQEILWEFIKTPSHNSFLNACHQIENDYVNICKRLGYGLVLPNKEKSIRYGFRYYSTNDKFQLSAVFGLMFTLFSVVFYHVWYFGYIFLGLSLLIMIYAYKQYCSLDQ